MNAALALFPEPGQAPGWFGKLPGLGDFAHRRLPEAFRELWDQWLQGGFTQLRLRHADWTARYLQGPLWFFVLGPGVAGERVWIGVLMPSVDGVGRYFPFTVAVELAKPLDEQLPAPSGYTWTALARWWQHAAKACLQALDQDLDAGGFDALLAEAPGDEPPVAGLPPAWPGEGQSLWFTDLADAQALSLRCAGLPRGARFERLFGFDEEVDASLAP